MIYNDVFLENSLEDDKLEEFKQNATDEVNKLEIVDTFLFDNLVRCRFYMLLSNLRAETEEAKLKYSIYEKEFKRYLELSTSKKVKSVKSVKLFRG